LGLKGYDLSDYFDVLANQEMSGTVGLERESFWFL
jgi:hypothetical protein